MVGDLVGEPVLLEQGQALRVPGVGALGVAHVVGDEHLPKRKKDMSGETKLHMTIEATRQIQSAPAHSPGGGALGASAGPGTDWVARISGAVGDRPHRFLR